MKKIISANGREIWSLDNEVKVVQVKPNILRDLGLLDSSEPRFIDSGNNVAVIPRLVSTANVLTDIPYGTRPQTVDEDSAGEVLIAVPHFAATATLLPADIKGKLSLDDFLRPKEGSPQFVTAAEITGKKLERLKKTVENTWEKAMFDTIRTGLAYAPNGTIKDSSGNPFDFYALFGGTRNNFTVDALDPDADIEGQLETARAWIQDNLGQENIVGEFALLAGSTLFNAIARHPEVKASVKAVGGQLAKRILIDGKPSPYGRAYRQIEFGGATIIEDRFHMTGTDVDKGILIALDAEDLFRTYYASPVDKFKLVNAVAQRSYAFRYDELGTRHESVEFDMETNFLHVLTRPNAIQRIVLGVAPSEDDETPP